MKDCNDRFLLVLKRSITVGILAVLLVHTNHARASNRKAPDLFFNQKLGEPISPKLKRKCSTIMPKARLMTFSCGQVRPYAQLLVLNTLDSRVYSIQALFDSNSEIPTETIYSAVIDQFGSPDRTIIKQRGRTELGSFVIGVQYWDWTGVTMTVNVSKVYSDSNPWGVDTGLFVTDSNLERAAKKLEAEIKLRATEQQHLRSIAQKKRIHF